MYKTLCINTNKDCGLLFLENIFFGDMWIKGGLCTAFTQSYTVKSTSLCGSNTNGFQSVFSKFYTFFTRLISTITTKLNNLYLLINRWDKSRFLSIILGDERELS